MKSEVFIYYGFKLKRKSKRIYRNSLKSIVKAKYNLIDSINTTQFYYSEISLQTKRFKQNLKNFNQFQN